MAVKTQLFHIAVCDTHGCGAVFDAAGDYAGWDDTPDLALDQVRAAPDSHWLVLADSRVVCPASDTAHYLARGGESPALLAPSRDAMTSRPAA